MAAALNGRRGEGEARSKQFGLTTPAKEFRKLVEECGHEVNLVAELIELADAFTTAADRRNELIHSTPHTADDGEQRLLRQKTKLDWTTDAIIKATAEFEELALRFNDVFHMAADVSSST